MYPANSNQISTYSYSYSSLAYGRKPSIRLLEQNMEVNEGLTPKNDERGIS